MSLSKSISKSDWWVILGFWGMATPIVLLDYGSNMDLRRSLEILFLDYILITSTALAIVYYIAPKYLSNSKYIIFFIGFFIILLLEAGLYWLGYSLIWQQIYIPNSWWEWLGDEIVSGGQSLGILGGILLAKKYFESQKNILQLRAETKSNELRALQSQVNPHFLFNNLNALDELIDSNPAEAKKYVNRLAQLYRYLINSKDEDVVTVAQELAFAKNYIYLLHLRYGRSYSFEIIDSLENKDIFLIPPASLQLIIENVVKHNIGSPTTPLKTILKISSDRIHIVNTKQLKNGVHRTSMGTGIENLKTRYKLLSSEDISIQESEYQYAVTLPLIPLLNS